VHLSGDMQIRWKSLLKKGSKERGYLGCSFGLCLFYVAVLNKPLTIRISEVCWNLHGK